MKRVAIISLLVLLFTACKPPLPIDKSVWQTGTENFDDGWSIAVDSNGNTFVAGATWGAFGSNVNGGSPDAFLMKYDSSGEQLWVKQIGTNLPDVALGVSIDANGHAIITGYTKGVLTGLVGKGQDDIFIIKYDSSGNQLWGKQVGTDYSDIAYDITTDSSNSIYITGNTFGAFPDSAGTALNNDVFLMKLDTNGNQLWVKQFGTTGSDFAYGVISDSNNVYVTGKTSGVLADNTAIGIIGNGDAFIAKFSVAGEKLWVKQFGTVSEDNARDIAVDSNSNTYITGYTRGAFPDHVNKGTDDAFVVKYDSTGNQVWVKQTGTDGIELSNGISIDPSNEHIFIAGSTTGAFVDKNAGLNGDVFVIKFNLMGEQQWIKQKGTSQGELVNGIAVGSGSQIYVAGATGGIFDSDIKSNGNSDVYIMPLPKN